MSAKRLLVQMGHHSSVEADAVVLFREILSPTNNVQKNKEILKEYYNRKWPTDAICPPEKSVKKHCQLIKHINFYYFLFRFSMTEGSLPSLDGSLALPGSTRSP